MLRWKLVIEYDVNVPTRTTSYTSISTKDLRDTLRRIRGGNVKASDLNHDIEKTTPVDPWLIQAAFDKVNRVIPHARSIISIKIEKRQSVVNVLGG